MGRPFVRVSKKPLSIRADNMELSWRNTLNIARKHVHLRVECNNVRVCDKVAYMVYLLHLPEKQKILKVRLFFPPPPFFTFSKSKISKGEKILIHHHYSQ